MSAEYRVTRDQAVRERETFYLDVPNEIPLVEHENYIHGKLNSGDLGSSDVSVVDSVNGIDTEVTITPV